MQTESDGTQMPFFFSSYRTDDRSGSDRSTEYKPKQAEKRADSRQGTARPEAEEADNNKPGTRLKRPLRYEKTVNNLQGDSLTEGLLFQANPLAPFQVPMIERVPVVKEVMPTPGTVIQPQILDQIVQEVRLGINATGAAEFQFDLRSDVLDGLKLKISTQDGKVVAYFIAENVHVKDVIDQGAQELVQALQQRGLEVAELQVSVGADAGGGSGEQQREQQQPFASSGSGQSVSGKAETAPSVGPKVNTNTRYTI